ncbi:MAG TPA: M14 metallopeptidase family protein [Bryobacteraceae bacterium]|nr:M14 metallopeptidase family protein [Bryobacteraceae bacterium]
MSRIAALRMRKYAALGAIAFAFHLQAAVPTPKSHFGHEIGADRELLDWASVVSYFQVLARSSDQVRFEELGKTVEGRPFIAAIIAAPETLRSLDRYKEIQRRLADPRITSEAEAEKLIAQGKTVVLLTCAIHSTEVASTHTAVEFAYRLLTEDKPRYRAILNNVILILVPSLNPDGVDIVTRWYRRTLGTAYEGTSPPELYHHYLGHDNNRDWYFFTQPETRLTVGKLHNVWHPEIVYDVHQQGPNASRIFVPPWLDPIEPNVDAILAQEMNWIGTAIAADLTAAGKKGVAIHAAYDFWSPARHYQAFHAGLRILTESASARLATPITIRPEQLDTHALGYNARERSWNFLEPWEGGEWHLRDIIDYQLIAFESCLYQAALHREDLVRNFYRVGRRAVARTEPAAFLIPVKQRDPGATRKLLETLDFGMVEIGRAPDGSHVISMTQPYGSFAKTLLERQNYPETRQYPGGPPVRPYDVTAQTLPLLMGVDVETLEKPFAGPLTREHFPEDQHQESFSASDTDSWFTVNRIWKSGGTVWRDPESGDFATSQKGSQWKELHRSRIGLYKSYIPAIDEGWTRWLFDEFGFVYKSLGNHEIQAGDLRRSYDVIVFPDQPARDLVSGYLKGAMPEEFTGGLAEAGAHALREFADQGGSLIFLNRSTQYAIEYLDLKVKNVVEDVPSRDFYAPGSLLNVVLDTRHPLTLGLPREIAIWSEHSPAWNVDEGSVARYPEAQILASGWLLGEKLIAGKTALADIRLGQGHVILFGMRPQYRGQSYQTFKLFFNALVY